RVVPIVEHLNRRWPELPLSVDTMKSDVARAALQAGAAIINDVTGLRHDPEMGGVIAEYNAGVVLMHSRGDAGELADYAYATYPDDVTGAVIAELETMRAAALAAGIAEESI